MHRDQLRDLFCRLHEHVERKCGRLVLAFGLGPAEYYPQERNYAFYVEPKHAHHFGADGQTGLILVGPRMLSATKDRCEAILRHEFGHAVDLQAERLPEGFPYLSGPAGNLSVLPGSHVVGSERRADAIAHSLWGVPILYDSCTLQSLKNGVTPRPTFLGE